MVDERLTINFFYETLNTLFMTIFFLNCDHSKGCIFVCRMVNFVKFCYQTDYIDPIFERVGLVELNGIYIIVSA